MSVNTITRNCVHRCIDLHQTGSVGAGSDHRQLIKFWRSCAPRKGSPAGGIFGAQCLRLSERFFHSVVFLCLHAFHARIIGPTCNLDCEVVYYFCSQHTVPYKNLKYMFTSNVTHTLTYKLQTFVNLKLLIIISSVKITAPNSLFSVKIF